MSFISRNSTQNSHAILFVDDEEKARKMFTRLVSPQFTVLTAADVKEAKAVLDEKHNEIGVLITDQRMPGELGVDLLRHTRKEYPKIIRMLTTAYSDLDDAIEAVNTGEIFRYINKPWNVDELLIDLRLAMNFFDIEQDRQQLIQEKMSLSHRQSRVEMVKSLITMSSAQSHYKLPKQAVNSFLQQVAEPQILAEKGFTLDASGYWENEINKTEKMTQINQSLNQWLEQARGYILEGGNTEAINYQECINQVDQALSSDVKLDTIDNDLSQTELNQQVCTSLLSVMMQSLMGKGKDSSNNPTISVTNTDQGVQILGTASTPNDDLAKQFLTLDDNSGDQQLGQLLAAFVLVNHVGGNITLAFDETNLTSIQAMLPQRADETGENNAENNKADIKGGIWIEDLFVLYN